MEPYHLKLIKKIKNLKELFLVKQAWKKLKNWFSKKKSSTTIILDIRH